MNTVYYAAKVTDDERSAQLFTGQIFVYPALPGATALVNFARQLIKDAFGELDPETAQDRLPPAAYEDILNSFKPGFTNHGRSKKLVRQLLIEAGCDN